MCYELPPRAFRLLYAVAISVTLIGCRDQTSRIESNLQGRDSAGIRIVEYTQLPSNLPLWSVSANPQFSVGSIDGDGPDAFGHIEGIASRSDGTIVVAESMTGELRAFDRSGRHLWTAGRLGSGPGEFQSLSGVYAAPADSTLAIDGGAFASIFDPQGHFVRRYRIDSPPHGFAGPVIVGATRAGRLVGYGIKMPPMESGYYRTYASLTYLEHDGSLRKELAELPHGEGIATLLAGGAYRSQAVPLGRRTQFAVGMNGVAVATQERFEILRYSSRGELDMVVRVLSNPLTVDAAVRAQYANHGLDGVRESEQQSAMRQSRLREVLPPQLPALGEIHYDSRDRLWVQEYVPPYEDRAPSWWVFDVEGNVVAEVSVPDNFSLHNIGTDRVIGIELDAHDVPYVQARSISRSHSAAGDPLRITPGSPEG